jgi:hypothetical protein
VEYILPYPVAERLHDIDTAWLLEEGGQPPPHGAPEALEMTARVVGEWLQPAGDQGQEGGGQ